MEQISTCSLRKTPCQSRWMPEGSCDPMGSPCWSRFLPGPVDPWRQRSSCWSRFAGGAYDYMGGPKLEQPVPEGLHPVKGTHAGAVCEELQPVGRTHVGEFHRELSPMGGTSCWSRGRV